jgi:hypothetical protein
MGMKAVRARILGAGCGTDVISELSVPDIRSAEERTSA